MFNKEKAQATTISIRDTLFGDLPMDYWSTINSSEIPWMLFNSVKQAIDKEDSDSAIRILKEIIDIPGLESRHYLQAFYFLRDLETQPNQEHILYGVVLEVAMKEGLDLLAVYSDHSARYYNYSGNAVVWDTIDTKISDKIDNILALGRAIVEQIGPWEGRRPIAPRERFARINFLASGGLHFGEADQGTLFKDPLSGKIMYAMLDMMETLINIAI